MNSNNSQSGGAQWNAPENVQWNNSSYHSGGNGKPPKQKSGIWKTVIACVCSALIASGASIGGFWALAGSGAISIGNNSSSSSVSTIQTTATSANSADTEKEVTGTLQTATAKAMDSVVLIQTYTTTGSMDFGYYYGYDFGGGSFGGPGSEDSGSEQLSGEGSGVIATSDGYIITNHHVVEGAKSVTVTLQDGQTYDAEVIGTDDVTDLALLKIEATGLAAADFGESSSLQVGDRVIAVGNPGGSEFASSATYGFVSATDRVITASSEYKMTCIQIDAAINPGNSGGALVNSAGQVVGITSSKIVSTEYEGLGFAIPIDTALPIINDIRENGKVTNRAAIGVKGGFIDSYTAQYYGMAEGYYVSEITNDAASKAGLKKGDIITKIDDTEVTSASELASYLLTKKPGDELTLTVNRDGEEKTVTFALTTLNSD